MQSTAQRIARAAVAGAVAVAGLTLTASPAPAAPAPVPVAPVPEPAAPATEPAVPPKPVQRPSGQPDFGLTPFGLNLGTFSPSPYGARVWPGDIGVSPFGAQLPAYIVKLRN
jgi:hypothetical protein